MTAIEDNDICRRCQHRCANASMKTYRNDVLINIHCEWCAEFTYIESYRKDGILRSRLILNAALWGIERTRRREDSRMEEWRSELLDRRSAPPLCVPEEQWTAYRRRLDEAYNLLPPRPWSFEKIEPSLERVMAIRNSEAIARDAEKAFGIFDGYGNALPQPRCYEAVNASVKRITEIVKSAYEPRVWFGGLQRFVCGEPVKGHSATANGIKMLSYCMAGRAMQTLSIESGESITLITAEDEAEPRMGIQGIEATEQHAVEMLRNAIELWGSGALKLQRDGEVSMF